MVKYRITPDDPMAGGLRFVDHQSAGRSGHLSHALVEYAPRCLLAFYSNCSRNRNRGHNGFGWVEYRRSTDGARTWGEGVKLPYSYNAFMNEPFTVSCEKAVSPAPNQIVAFCIRNLNPNGWEPYLEPVVLRSFDGGATWSDAAPLCGLRGRVYDAICEDGVIYALMLANPDFLASEPEHRYYIYASRDGGATFYRHGERPGDTLGRAYGSMAVREDGSLLCCTYNVNDEFNMDYHISADMGKTWIESGKSYCAKRIRNPQLTRVKGGYILHGRSGCVTRDLPLDFVLYTGEDGVHWDEGRYICSTQPDGAYYSNSLALNDPDGGQRVLIQSSVGYDEARVNICHWIMDILPDGR